MKYLIVALATFMLCATPAFAITQPDEEYHKQLCNDAFAADENSAIITYCRERVTNNANDSYADVGDENSLDFMLCAGINEIRVAMAERRLGNDDAAATSYQFARRAYETARSITANPRLLSEMDQGRGTHTVTR
jgi:hypothetical protein